MNKNEYFIKLLKSLEAERKSEENYYANLSQKTSLNQKISSGMAWGNISFVKKYYTIGEQIELAFERDKSIDQAHKLKIGAGCALHLDFPESKVYRGVISFVSRSKIKIIMNASIEYIDEYSLSKGRKHIELVYDERPYKVMYEAIENARESQSPLIQAILGSLIHQNDIDQYVHTDHHKVELPHLNESQNNALNAAITNDKLSIIHGPPGTGKTTTITELVRQLVKTENKILVTASSNNAVDLLCKKIAERQINVLRVGNISRIIDQIVQYTINEKIRNHSEWSHIKKVKIQAEEARKIAKSYKRSFGPAEREQRDMMYREFKELKKWGKELEQRLLDQIIDESAVIATTLIGSSHSSICDIIYDTVIIDEASQALEPECWNVILKAKRVIFVGDHKQLPPTVKSSEAAKQGLRSTLLEKLNENIQSSYLLTLQYRMNEDILKFPNTQFYNELLRSADANKSHRLPNDTKPIVFIDTSGCGFEEQLDPQHRSFHNDGEYFIMREFILRHQESILGASIGIIAPYASQVKFMRSQYTSDPELHIFGLEAGTIDGYQGQERDLIIISLVRSNQKGEIGFLKDERRLNVALTRAKKKLVIIGDSSTLARHPIYQKLVDHIDQFGHYQSAWEYMA